MSTRNQSTERKAQLDRRQQEDARFTTRVLVTFGLAAILLFASIRLSAWIDTATATEIYTRFRILLLALAGALVLSKAAAWFLYFTKRRTGSTVLFYATAVLAIAVGGVLFLWRFPNDGLWPLCVIILGIALLYLLYFIYPLEFSLLSVLTGGGALGFWFLRRMFQTDMYGTFASGRSWPSRATLPVVAFSIAIAGSVLLILLLRSRKGKLGPIRVLPLAISYMPLLGTCALLALGLIVTIIFGWMAALVLMITCLVYLFIAAIYYTSKLM